MYASVTAIARNVAQVPFKLWVGETELSDTDPLQLLFSKPNPLLSGYELFYGTECYLQLTGNCLWVPVPGVRDKSIAEIWMFSGREIKPIVNKQVFTGWEVKRGEMTERFDYSEVIHFRYFNPYNPIMGMAPLEAARLAIDQSWWAQKYNEAFFQNFAEPGVIITFPGDYNAKVMAASRESWDQRHQGFARAKKTAILWGGAQLKELGASKRDMEFIAQMKWGREEVLAVFHVPPVEVMLVDQVSSRVESQRAQRRLFGEEVVAPELKMLEDKILPIFTMVGRPEVRGWFDTSEVSILQESYGEKIDQAKKLFDMLIPINAIIDKLDLGFEPFDWGDEAYILGTMVPVSQLGMVPVEPDEEPDDEDEPEEEPEDEEPTDVPGGVRAFLGPRARKLKRVLFELRNETLRAKDGWGEVDWVRVQKRLDPLVPDAAGMVERLRSWTGRATKDEVRVAYSKLKNHVTKLALPELQERATKVQSVICSKSVFKSVAEARSWVSKHGFKSSGVDETEESYRFRQFAPSQCTSGSFRTITLTKGVSAVICTPKQKKQSPEELARYPRIQREENESVVPQWTEEVLDFDAIWYSYERDILPLEQRMEKVLVAYFTEWEREFMQAWAAQEQGVAGVIQAGIWDFDPNDAKLQAATQPVIEKTMTTMGSCSSALSTETPIQTTHVPQNKADRSLAVKETKDLVKLLGGTLPDNNHNTDILVGKNAVEVKAITARKNDRVINMSPATKAAKQEYLERFGLKGHTVVIDLREGKKLYYYSEGIGSRSLGQMKVVSEAELKALINAGVNGATVKIEQADKIEHFLIKNKTVVATRDASLAAAKEFVEKNIKVPTGPGGGVLGSSRWFDAMRDFLQAQGFKSPDYEPIVTALSDWLGSSHAFKAQKLTNTVAEWVGRDPAKNFVGTHSRNALMFPKTEVVDKIFGAIKALSEEYYMKHMRNQAAKGREEDVIYRGVSSHRQVDFDSGKVKLAINPISSWSTSRSLASGSFAEGGTVIKEKISREHVFMIIPGHEWEVLAIHPKEFLAVPKGSAYAVNKGLKKGDIVLYIDDEPENADWLKKKKK